MSISLEPLESFVDRVENFQSLKATEQIDYFLYYLTIEENMPAANATPLRECFIKLRLSPYSNISAYLGLHLKPRDNSYPKFLRLASGYILHRSLQDKLQEQIKDSKLKRKISRDLRSLLVRVKKPYENEFLKEAIDCFEISAYRATITMTWNLTLDHLYEYILKNKLAEFNSALASNTDRRVRITSIISRDDFNEIPEGKFVEFCRTSNIISNDIRKILDTKLGIRNTSAHPSNIRVLESKALEFVEDLVNNVVLKFEIQDP